MALTALTALTAPIETDAVVIGAGPAGLFQVFQLGLLEVGAHVVDSLPQPGGQCLELYADKPIYDVPGVPLCTGRTLTDQLLQQIAPFKAPLHLGQVVTDLQRQADGRFALRSSRGTQFVAKVVVIASGVGAFLPRGLKLPGLDAFAGTQVFHDVADASTARVASDRHVLIVGGGAAAIGAALQMAAAGAPQAASVTLLHRRDVFDAPTDQVQAMHALCASGRMQLVLGQPTGFEAKDGKLTALTVLDHTGAARVLPVDQLLVLQGLSPRLGPIADWGLALERKQLVVDTAGFQTSVPGIFAVGDINHYPGKKKLIVCGFHEATLAAFAAAAIVHPQRPLQLQYTTTSPRLHQLLGVQAQPPTDAAS